MLFYFLIPLLFFVNIISCQDNVELDKNSYNIPNLSGKKLPEIECLNLAGKKELIKHRKGQIIVINNWSTSCIPCIVEIPGLNKLVDKYQNNNNIRFIAISGSRDSTKLVKFLEETEYKFEQKRMSEYSKKHLYGPIPRNIVCSQNGIVIYDRFGGHPDKYKEIEIVIESLLNGSQLYFLN